MVASKHINRIFELQFDGKYQSQNLNWKRTPIYIITQKEVFCGLEWASGILINEFDEIEELSVDISNDGDRVLDPDDIGFLLYMRKSLRKTVLARLSSSR